MGLLGGYCETDEERAAIEQRDRDYMEADEAAKRIAELEAALKDCLPLVAVYADRYRRDYGGGDALHPVHAELIDRVSRLTGGQPLAEKLVKAL